MLCMVFPLLRRPFVKDSNTVRVNLVIKGINHVSFNAAKKTPDLKVETLPSGAWTLSMQSPQLFTIIVFYRGLHCPICKTYLKDLERYIKDFWQRGIEVIVVSGDASERAQTSMNEWGLNVLTIGYGQSIDSMREWGLYVSNSITVSEPTQFGEPGVFLIQPTRELYYAAINSMPFARPSFKDLLSAVDWVSENNYPARGEA